VSAKLLTCKHCGSTVFVKLEAGQYLFRQDYLDQGLPLPKHIVDEYTLGGGVVYRCLECDKLVNQPRT